MTKTKSLFNAKQNAFLNFLLDHPELCDKNFILLALNTEVRDNIIIFLKKYSKNNTNNTQEKNLKATIRILTDNSDTELKKKKEIITALATIICSNKADSMLDFYNNNDVIYIKDNYKKICNISQATIYRYMNSLNAKYEGNQWKINNSESNKLNEEKKILSLSSYLRNNPIQDIGLVFIPVLYENVQKFIYEINREIIKYKEIVFKSLPCLEGVLIFFDNSSEKKNIMNKIIKELNDALEERKRKKTEITRPIAVR